MPLTWIQAWCRIWQLAALLTLVCCLFPPAAECAEGEDLLSELEVAYIFNFTRFIQWPEAPASRPFVIGVIGDPAMEEQLRVLEHDDRRVDGRQVKIRSCRAADAIGPCEILFVGAAAKDQLAAIVRQTAGKPTLLIGDTRGYAGRGAAIKLFRKPDIFGRADRLRLRIDPKALQGRGLVISAQLYDVAEVIE